MWKILVAIPYNIGFQDYYPCFGAFGNISSITSRSIPLLSQMFQLRLTDFDSFISEKFNKMQYLEISFYTITNKKRAQRDERKKRQG
jgi:hypothetical protein